MIEARNNAHAEGCKARAPGKILAVGWISEYGNRSFKAPPGHRGFPKGWCGTEVYSCSCGWGFLQSHWDWTPNEGRQVAQQFGVKFCVTMRELIDEATRSARLAAAV